MHISDAQYDSWLADRRANPVHLSEITHTSGAISRLSTRAIRPADSRAAGQIWRSRMGDVSVEWGIDGGVGGYSEIASSRLEFNNEDRALDGWRDDPVTDVVVKLGDESWDVADYRAIMSGQVDYVKVGKVCKIEMRGPEGKADTINYISSAPGLPGTALQAMLITYGGFTVGDIDTARLNQLDADYPYPVNGIYSDLNLLEAIDIILGGFPIDWGVGFDGKVTIFELSNPQGASTYRDIKPVSFKEPEVQAPVWRVTFSGDFGTDETQERAATKTAYPSAKEINLKTSVSEPIKRTALANKILDLYDKPRDRLEITTDRRDRFVIGDECKVAFPDIGYDQGRYGVITRIARKGDMQNLELRV